ncbi:MAG: heavy-metal-associated domain-containing protein [Chloroflexales bacterium]|nr:heavy-metal-associated domain-containing protein [Chloroflexales bacterium]
MKTEKFLVPAVSCQHCVRAVTSEVGKVAGVSDVKVNLDSKVVTVEAGDTVAPEAIVAAIKEAGYEDVSAVA